MCVSRRGSCVLRVGKRRAAGPRAAWVARASTPSMGRARGGARVAATILHGIVFGGPGAVGWVGGSVRLVPRRRVGRVGRRDGWSSTWLLSFMGSVAAESRRM